MGQENPSTRWWQLKYVFIFTPNLGEDEPNLTSIFFKWVETQPPNQINLCHHLAVFTCQVVGCQVPCLNSRFRREAAAKNEAKGMRESLRRNVSLLGNMAIENPMFNREYPP